MDIIRELKVSRPTGPVRLLALISVLLALMCVGLAVAWKSKADDADCWREAFEDDMGPAAAGRCG